MALSTYIAMLRGINVGGKNTVRMEALRQMFEQLDFACVQTYIQSGNVVFKSAEGPETVQQSIEQKFEQAFGFTVPVLVRSLEELEKLIEHCPFSEEELEEAAAASTAESLYVAFLKQAPCPDDIERLSAYRNENEKFQIHGREVFLLFYQGIRNSKLANHLDKLGIPITVRNWNTVNKLAALARRK
ncbi:DUF1697 domain-containing protein [Propionispora hippei]|uniref:Uncharacterized conserved protein, DUF1697 family n=1 Tax=Propionispora hippei DSM 15287 TaxID=1123003 RepID=A0A1M6KFY6_9FIRM|nr:DUF1697 domain-containing protein [Propionispora hippei]SHJ57820.1 Uncharacterized conserved protein, DUF1697 family [Propionispora hippei DSM 15287]